MQIYKLVLCLMPVCALYAQSPEALKDIYVPARVSTQFSGASSTVTTATASSTPLPSRDPTTGAAVNTAANPMFDNPPKCFLHRQGNFITQAGFFPAKVVANIDNQVGADQSPQIIPDTNLLAGES